MSDDSSLGLTVVGGRPDDEGPAESPISPGLQALLKRLAEEPQLAHDLVLDPEATLAREGLTLAPAELAMLHHLDVEDLEQTRAMTRGAIRGTVPREAQAQADKETRLRRAAQLELVAPFVDDPGSYTRDRTRGIRPQSIYPLPFVVCESLLRSSTDFRKAFLADARNAVLTWPDLPLTDRERRELLAESVIRRLEQVARSV